jgi:hypothetical protein
MIHANRVIPSAGDALAPEHAPSGLSIFELRQREREEHPPDRPLGILQGVSIREDQEQALRVIADYDLSPIRDRLVRAGTMTPGWADEAIFEFRRYLGIRALVEAPISMLSAEIDQIWHTCLIHTRLYADLCDKVFGCFQHHDPAAEATQDREGLWHEFEGAYVALYGSPGPLWELARPVQHA